MRCCVWRRSSGKLESACLPADCDMRVCEAGPHHCRTCGRCVNHFDHHCGLFGRCIAGQGCSGNIHYFYAVRVRVRVRVRVSRVRVRVRVGEWVRVRVSNIHYFCLVTAPWVRPLP